MNNEIFKQILKIGETQEEGSYYCLVLGDNANIQELKVLISENLKCDLFNKDLLTIKICEKELCNAYHSLGDYNCAEIYYDNKCITGYFLGNFDFKDVFNKDKCDISGNGNVLNLPSFKLPRDCNDVDFEKAAEELYPNLSYKVVYDSCVISPFNGKENEGTDEVDPDLMMDKWLEIKENNILKNNFSIFRAHAV